MRLASSCRREAGGMEDYISELNERAPYRKAP